jgi:hypothetical protein
VAEEGGRRRLRVCLFRSCLFDEGVGGVMVMIEERFCQRE